MRSDRLNLHVCVQVASLASATFVCTLGREQQYFLNAKGQIWDQPRSAIRLARASLMASALARRRLSTSRDSLASSSLPHGVGVGSYRLYDEGEVAMRFIHRVRKARGV